MGVEKHERSHTEYRPAWEQIASQDLVSLTPDVYITNALYFTSEASKESGSPCCCYMPLNGKVL